MAASRSKSTSVSLKEYLKKYESNSSEDQTGKKKKKKKLKSKTQQEPIGVRVVDEDPVWAKPVNIDAEEESDSADEEKPVIDEDIEVKRMKRLEEIRARRPYLSINDDGSGWVSVSEISKASTSNGNQVPDLSPPRQRRPRLDSPEPEQKCNFSSSGNEVTDLSPPRQHQRRRHTPMPEFEREPSNFGDYNPDLSPPRQRRRRFLTPSPKPEQKLSSEPELKRMATHSPYSDLSPPRRSRPQTSLSDYETKESKRNHSRELSPPLHSHPWSSLSDFETKDVERNRSLDLSPPQRVHDHSPADASHVSQMADLSPPRKSRKDSSSLKVERRAGLFTGQDIKKEIDKKKEDDLLRFSEMDPSATGRGAEPIYRHQGKRISKEEYLKLQQGEEKPKEKKLEWGKGLAQKREAEARELELQMEKDKPFARTRDDPDLDKMLKERVRWGDPMAHLVKKSSKLILEDLGDDEKMKESGFLIPQTIPSHSWLKRGIDPPANRYLIKPGRHWDGVDRSTGYEQQMFKRQNEKRATETEAYLWSVSEM